LREAEDEARAVLEQLRNLAHGIYPAVLTDSGLSEALASVPDESTVPVRLHGDPLPRFTTPVERAVYVAVNEAIAKACAEGATVVDVDLVAEPDRLVARVMPLRLLPDASVLDRLGALDARTRLEGEAFVVEVPCG
jgi:signal transduction histidine kinase